MLQVDLLGIKFTSFDNTQEFMAKILDLVNSNKCNSIYTPNAEMIARASSDTKFLKVLKNASINLPDGFGIALLARKKGFNITRFPGIEAMLEILRFSEERGIPVYFLGAKKHVLESMLERLKTWFPNLKIAGYRDGYFREEEESAIVEEINNSQAEILFVALGFPKQELWIDKHKNFLRVKIAMGVGGSFDVLSGKKKRAPKIVRRLNLEWLYRILQDPKRLLNRLPNLFKFLLLYFSLNSYEKNI